VLFSASAIVVQHSESVDFSADREDFSAAPCCVSKITVEDGGRLLEDKVWRSVELALTCGGVSHV
tara:strand:- start:254 stop:448 length:195 start_codon:yes stop_codon:yes gene_type:complete